MRSNTEHHWLYSDDIVAVYLAYHGDKLLGQSRERVSMKLGIKKGSMKMRESNILGVLTQSSEQSRNAREKYKNFPEPELRAIVLGILLRASDEGPPRKN
jgi:hypothetical protein